LIKGRPHCQSAWIVPIVLGTLLSALGQAQAQNTLDILKTVVVVSSDNPRLSGQLFHPKICPNLLNEVAFVRQVRDNRQLWLYDARTKNLLQVTPQKSADEFGSASGDADAEGDEAFKGYEDELDWCPVLHGGKQYFAFVSAGGVNNHDIYLGCIGSDTYTRLTFDPEVDDSPHWSPDGKGLVFVSARTGNGDLYFIPDAISFFGKELKQEPRDAFERLTRSPGEEMFPAFSPDGRFLAFTMRTGGGAKRVLFTIALMDFKENRKIMAFNNQIVNSKSQPSWSYDGHFLAYQISNDLDDRTVDIGVMQIKMDSLGHLVEVADLQGSDSKIAENIYPSSYGGPAWLAGSRALIYPKRESNRFNPLEAVNLERWLYGSGDERISLNTASNIHRDVDCLPNDPIVIYAGESGKDFQIFASILGGEDVPMGGRSVNPDDYDLFRGVPDVSR
jgi:Tol biopolymer transport system component